MKKVIGTVVIVCLLLAVVAGCSNGTNESSTNNSSDKTKDASNAPSTSNEEVTIQFFHTTWVPGMLKILDDAIADFEAKNPGIKIQQTRSSWTDAPSQLMTSIMGGTPPDLIMCNPPMVAQFRGMNALADLTNRIPKDMFDDFLPIAKEIITAPDGKVDGLPQEGCNWALFYRKDLFEEAGLDPNKPPTTWDELIEYGKKLTKDTDGDGVIDQWGFGWPVQAENANDFWVNFMQQAGAKITVYENGNWISKLSEPEAYTGTKFMVDLVQAYKISPESIVNMDWEAVTNDFVSGKIAMMHNGAWVVDSVKQKGPNLNDKWGTALLFSGPGGPAYRGYPNTFNILKASEKQDETWKFLEYFYTTPSSSNPDITIAGDFCGAAGSMLYTKSYLDYAHKHYEPLLQPFIDAVDGCKVPPLDPQWQTFSNMFVQPKIQQMILGEVNVKDGLADLDANLKKLHGEK
jgi:ABC-type glycerol-3-phosphate transport system substrate-binding protein